MWRLLLVGGPRFVVRELRQDFCHRLVVDAGLRLREAQVEGLADQTGEILPRDVDARETLETIAFVLEGHADFLDDPKIAVVLDAVVGRPGLEVDGLALVGPADSLRRGRRSDEHRCAHQNGGDNAIQHFFFLRHHAEAPMAPSCAKQLYVLYHHLYLYVNSKRSLVSRLLLLDLFEIELVTHSTHIPHTLHSSCTFLLLLRFVCNSSLCCKQDCCSR